MTMVNNLVRDLYHIMSWIPWIAGGGVIFYAILFGLALIGLPFATTVLNILSPLLKAIVQGAVDFVVDVLLPGLMDIVDSWKTVVFVLTLLLVAGYGSYKLKECPVIYKPVPAKTRTIVKWKNAITHTFTPAPVRTPASKGPVVQKERTDSLVRPFWENGE